MEMNMGPFAYQYRCEHSIERVGELLNEAGPWEWTVRDSSWYGDYLDCHSADGPRIRIHEFGDNDERYLTLLVDGPTNMSDRYVMDIVAQWFEAIGAADVQDTDPYD
jgi:hypothetical protein